VEVPGPVKSALNAAINAIPNVSGVQLSGGSITGTAKKRECCDPPIKYEKCCDGNLTLSASIGGIEIFGSSFNKEIDFWGWGASINITASVSVGGDVTASATAGQYENPCDEGCLYGSGSISASPGVTAEVSGCCCVKVWGDNHCSPEIGASGGASISFTGSVQYNSCGSCDGLDADIKLNDIILTGTVTVPGYSGSFEHPIYEDP